MVRRFRASPASRASDKTAASGRGGGADTRSAAPPASADGKGEGGRPAPLAPAGHVVVAEFGRAHGIRGEVRLKSYTADPGEILGYGPFVRADGALVRLTSLRPAPGADQDLFVVQVDGVTDRNAAEALARQRLFVPRERLPQLDNEDEFYLTDLVGLAVEDNAGRIIGAVLAVHDFGAGDMVEIKPAPDADLKRASVMVAFTRAFVPVVDIAGRRLVLAVNPFLPESAGSGDDGAGT